MRHSLFWDVRGVDWLLVTDVSGQHVGPIYKGHVGNYQRCITSQKFEDLNDCSVLAECRIFFLILSAAVPTVTLDFRKFLCTEMCLYLFCAGAKFVFFLHLK